MKKSNIKTIISSLTAFVFMNAVQAQEFQIEVAGHLLEHKGSESIAWAKSTDGFSLGVGYNQYITENWSIGTGVSYLRANLSFGAHAIKGNYMTVDLENDPFSFRYKVGHFEETVKWESFRIPLTIQYETKGIVRWYLRTGVLYGLQVGNSKDTQMWNEVTTSGYYPEWDAELHGPEFAGFGKIGNVHTEDTTKLKNTFSWILETGVKQKLENNNDIYFGVFVEMGLQNMRGSESAEAKLITYTSDVNQPLEFNSVLKQEQFKNKEISPLMFGFKIKYAFEF